MDALAHRISAVKLDSTDTVVTRTKAKPTLMDLPVEVLLKIAELCLLAPVRKEKPSKGPLGRYASKYLGKPLGGAVRDLTLVNRYWRELTAPFLFESICINDVVESSFEDYLRITHMRLLTASANRWLQHTNKFTISLGHSPNEPRKGHEEDFIRMLNYVQSPTIVRYQFPLKASPRSILPTLKACFEKLHDKGVELQVLKPRQLEFYSYWGEYNFDFQFLTWPYAHVERIWLDFNITHVRAESLCLDRLKHLQYVMCRSIPPKIPYNEVELHQFKSFTSPDGVSGPPKLQQLADTLGHLKHFAMYGPLYGRVTDVAPLLRSMKSLEQLDITDQQAVCETDLLKEWDMWHPYETIDWSMKNTDWLNKHRNNVDRIEAATVFFKTLPSLQRICFVRDQVGVVYHVIRDDAGGVESVTEGETIQESFHIVRYDENSPAWRCGFPNRLNYDLLAPSHMSLISAKDVFWRNPDYIAGDRSVIPDWLKWDTAWVERFGVRSAEELKAEEERMARIDKACKRRREAMLRQRRN